MEAEGGDNEEETTEPIMVEKGKDKLQTNMELEKEGKRTQNPQDHIETEIDPQKDKGSKEEQVMKRF